MTGRALVLVRARERDALPNQQASQRAADRKYLLVPIGALEIEGLPLLLHDRAVLGEDTVR